MPNYFTIYAKTAVLPQSKLVYYHLPYKKKIEYFVRWSTQVRIVLYLWASGKSVVKTMLQWEKKILGLEGAEVNLEGLEYCLLFVHKWCTNGQKKSLFHAAWATKPFGKEYKSVSIHQGGQPMVSHGLLWWETHEIHHFGEPQSGPLHYNYGV